MTMGDVAGAVGRGLFAGAVGTAAMTVSSTLEMKLRGREGCSAPADAAAKVLGVESKGDAEKARFEMAPPLKEWGPTEVAIDGFHHTVYVTTTSMAFALLSRPVHRHRRR